MDGGFAWERRFLGRSRAAITRFQWRLPEFLEQRFEGETRRRRNQQIRFWQLAFLVFTILTTGLDFLSIPQYVRLGAALRIGIYAPVTLIAATLLARPRARWVEFLASVTPPIVGVAVIQVLFVAASDADLVRPVFILSLLILSCNALLPLRVAESVTFTSLSLLIGYGAAVAGAQIKHLPIRSVLDLLIAALMLGVMSVIGRVVAERQARATFVLGLKLRLRARDLARMNETLVELSYTDPLTGVANRRAFDIHLERVWQAAFVARSSVALLLIDIDHFKFVNDRMGHMSGDECLVAVSRAIVREMRHGKDVVARFGGDEFAVLLPGADYTAARDVAERVCAAVCAVGVHQPRKSENGLAPVTVSIGVSAAFPAHGDSSPQDLIAQADRALYAAKAAGRNGVA